MLDLTTLAADMALIEADVTTISVAVIGFTLLAFGIRKGIKLLNRS